MEDLSEFLCVPHFVLFCPVADTVEWSPVSAGYSKSQPFLGRSRCYFLPVNR